MSITNIIENEDGQFCSIATIYLLKIWQCGWIWRVTTLASSAETKKLAMMNKEKQIELKMKANAILIYMPGVVFVFFGLKGIHNL